MQSKKDSVKEVLTNTATGMAGSFAITLACNYSIDNRAIASAVTVALCTVWSLVRGYYIRRRFNRKLTQCTTQSLQ